MIKVTVIESHKMFPFIVEFGNFKNQFTKKAAAELKNKLQKALDELEEIEVKAGK